MLILKKTKYNTVVVNLDQIGRLSVDNDMESYSIVFEFSGFSREVFRFFYDSKLEAENFVSKILDAYKNGEKVVDISQSKID